MRRLVFFLASCALVACGGSNGTPPATTALAWYPLGEGYAWTYRVVEQGVTVEKRREVVGTHDLAGRTVWMLESREGGERLVAWTDYTPEAGVRRYRDEHYSLASGNLLETNEYEPYTLRMPPPGLDGDMSENYAVRTTSGSGVAVDRREKLHRWSIVSENEELTVPAGTFRTLHVRRLNDDGSKSRDFWYAAGIGKVKETGDFVEELVSYEVP